MTPEQLLAAYRAALQIEVKLQWRLDAAKAVTEKIEKELLVAMKSSHYEVEVIPNDTVASDRLPTV